MDLVRIALLTYPLVALLLFWRLPRHWAVLATVMLGTMFLPEVQIAKVSKEAPDANTFVYVILKFTKPNPTCFSDLARFRDLGMGLVLGGLLYVPFCLWESKFFPNFHLRLYGFFPGDPNEALRAGGYRPVVFMSHGLMTSLWMVATALVAGWLW